MQLSRFVEALRNDLAAVAEMGDEETAEAARRIAVSIQGLAMQLAALGEAAVELNRQLADGRVEVRLVGQDPELVFVPGQGSPTRRRSAATRRSLRASRSACPKGSSAASKALPIAKASRPTRGSSRRSPVHCTGPVAVRETD